MAFIGAILVPTRRPGCVFKCHWRIIRRSWLNALGNEDILMYVAIKRIPFADTLM